MGGFMIALTMMLSIGLSIILQMEEEFGRDDSHKFSVCLMLGIAYAASMGGMAAPVGTPPNLVFQRTFELTFPKAPPVSFGIWMVMAVPLSVFMILTIWLVLTKVVYRRTLVLQIIDGKFEVIWPLDVATAKLTP